MATHLATGAECGTESSSSFLLGERPLRFCKSAELFRSFSPLSANLTLELLLCSFFADFDLNRASGIRLLLCKQDMFKITFWAVINPFVTFDCPATLGEAILSDPLSWIWPEESLTPWSRRLVHRNSPSVYPRSSLLASDDWTWNWIYSWPAQTREKFRVVVVVVEKVSHCRGQLAKVSE